MSSPVVDLCSRYKNQFQMTAQTLQDRGSQLGAEAQAKVEEVRAKLEELKVSLEPQVQRFKDDFKSQVEDVSPIDNGAVASDFLLQTQLWTAICLVGMSVGHLVGRYFLSMALGLVLDTSVTLLLSFVALPVWFYFFNRKVSASEDDKRMVLFGVSVLIGVLSGFILCERHLHFFSPPAFLLPATIGIMAVLLGPKFANDRKLFLGVTVGSAAGVYLLLALLIGGLSFPYLVWMVVACGVAAIQLQMTLGELRQSKADAIENQLFSVLADVLIQSLFFLLCGNTAERAAEIEQQQQAAKQ